MVLLVESRYKDLDSYNKRILRITIPVALTSYLRSGLSTVKQLIIPYSLQKSGMNSSNSLIAYGIVNGMAMPIIMFPVSLVISFSTLLVSEFSRCYTSRKIFKNKSNFSNYFNWYFDVFYNYSYFDFCFFKSIKQLDLS